ncbi:MAG: acetyl-CoA hydrolase/transferase C-terminal domain-containing protein, partial [Woeseiaceae bacterium]|nr:acetyl-CoA hydrolase/transferase C-terminal domain-containing protein [Woeseiaceae bacterium]
MTRTLESADALAGELLNRVGSRIVLGLPVGIGKAIHIADALFERARSDTSISLTIFTGLTLEVPRARGDLERRFLEPFAERLYAEWPTPAYARALRENQLPPNVEVHEFYLRPGAWLGNPVVQQSYASVNYSHVAATLIDLGVNVIAQLVAVDESRPGQYSLASNPEVTLDLLEYFEGARRQGREVALVGQINRRLPWMGGDAVLEAKAFDLLLDNHRDFPPFGLPSRPVGPADFAAGMHVASLVPDDGTLQVGIGSLSDAVAHCLVLRHRKPALFRDLLKRLPGGTASARRAGLPVYDQPFEQGLFASTELLSDALLHLVDAGIVKRPAGEGDDAVVHAGFFIGSERLYAWLRDTDDALRDRIRMKAISEVNTLFGDETRKRRQRRRACFVNETMMVTLLGAAISDGLEDGRVVSGVGGQFDFVTMARRLSDARSILVCPARRLHDGRPRSNIRWSYGHATVPRHYRDIVVSEYGIADLRGISDRRVIEAMLSIADSSFQEELIDAATEAGKLPADFSLPQETQRNTPEAINAALRADGIREHFPEYPLGSDFTPVEQRLVRALR